MKIKKTNFINGAIIGTMSLVICKIMGLIYVIPFYKIVGSQGGALYSYAYSIYAIFLNLSSVGIPSAISKIISEYDTLDYQNSKHRAFKLASKMLNYMGIISFIIMFLFANVIAEMIIGGVEGGNSVENVAMSIRAVSTALLIVPRLSIIKGYFMGNKYITQPSISAVIEQFVRVIIIIVGSYVTVRLLGLPIEIAVYIAAFAATVAALSAFIYLKVKSRQIKEDKLEIPMKEEEKSLTTKVLLKKIIIYAIPFVIMSLLQSAYRVVDTFTVVRTLSNVGFDAVTAENIFGVLNTWASKINMIVISLSIGITGSLIPNVVGSFTKKDYKDVNEKLSQSFKMLLLLTIPMAFGLSFLAPQVWHLFYGVNELNSSIYRIHVLSVIIYGLFTTSTTITQAMNQTKITIGALVSSFLIKAIINVPLMHLFSKIGLPAYYAPILADTISQAAALTGVLIILKKKYAFVYKSIFVYLGKVMLSLVVMAITLILLKQVYYNNISVITALITVVLHAVVGAFVYFLCTRKFKLLEELLGKDYGEKLKRKFKRKKVQTNS